jgi:hypothetical protein
MDETAQERRLRMTLRRQAAVDVDVDQAWKKVAPQLTTMQSHTQPRNISSLFASAQSQRAHHSVMKRIPTLVAVALVAVFLLSACLATGISQWAQLARTVLSTRSQTVASAGSGFQVVGQRQESMGVTLIVESAHADATQASIKYSVPLKSSSGPVDDTVVKLLPPSQFIVNGQRETLTTVKSECDRELVKQIEQCLLVLSPIHVPEHTSMLNITWDFTSVTVQKSHTVDVQHGHWHFQFAIPYQRQSV